MQGCAYYNTFYNAQKFYKEGEKERRKREKTQVVELSAEEEAQLRKIGRSGSDERNRAGQQEMQNYQQAIERASRVLEYFPNSRWVDDALMLLGRCFYYRREFKKADRKFDELINLYPTSKWIPEARLLKAKTAIDMELYDDAEQQLRLLIEDEAMPKKIREQAKYELGGLFFQRGLFEEAAEYYRSSSRSADDKLVQAMSLYRLGECMLRLERYDQAADAFRRAVKLAPNEDFNAQAQFKLGQALSLQADYDRAVKTYRTLLSKEFDEKRIPRVKLELAENLRRKGELAEAIKWYKEIIELHKRTDASARAYFALGEIEEYLAENYTKAKENYDLVRSEFANSAIAEIAQQRSANIRSLLELREEIAKLEGRSTAGADTTKAQQSADDGRDDAPIDLSMDGMWANYAGRDRPPPLTLTDLTESDLQRQALAKQHLEELAAAGDTTAAKALTPAVVDSAALLKKQQQEAAEKQRLLVDKYLSLGEVFLFSFNKPDSAAKYYQAAVEHHVDSAQTARALYSLAFLYKEALHDTLLARRVFDEIINLFPETRHAEGARRALGLPLQSDRVDSARILFMAAEEVLIERNDVERALELYDKVMQRYPDSPYAQKAAFAKAYHYEKTLFQLDKAVEAYEAMLKAFPNSAAAALIKPKLAAVEQKRREQEARAKAVADSLAKLEKIKSAEAAPKDHATADTLTQTKAAPPPTGAPADSETVRLDRGAAADSAAAESQDEPSDEAAHEGDSLQTRPSPAPRPTAPPGRPSKIEE